MQIYTVIRKGEFHPVYCEDFLITEELGHQYFLTAVMDGCSSGRESHFASALLGKILRKIAQTILHQPEKAHLLDLPGEQLLPEILRSFFEELSNARNFLLLGLNETLSTLILLLYNKSNQQATLIVLGDGFVAIDGQMHEIDQDNHPDYPAYHLGEDFETWFASQQNIFHISNPQEISISTDGIATFQSNRVDIPEGFSPMNFLLLDDSLAHLDNMLVRKCNILDKKYGFKPGDDVAIVRVKFE